MNIKKISAVFTPAAPAPIGPYSQAIRVGSFLYLSGQIALDPATGKLVGKTIVEQTEQVMKNALAVLRSQGLTARNIVKTTVFLKQMDDFGKFNQTYESFVCSPYPARSTVGAQLPKDALVEIEMVAVDLGA